jgi:pimeloyl-ACP methyl ester carboxylesterase
VRNDLRVSAIGPQLIAIQCYAVCLSALLYVLLAPAALLFAGWLYQQMGAARDRRRHPPPGNLVKGLHVQVTGHGLPPVVLEAGIAASSLSWARLAPELSREFLTVRYDRAGLAWSRLSPEPRTPDSILTELKQLLDAIELPRPFVFVGHSFGGLIGRLYAARHREEVAGLVLIDPALLMEWADPPPQRRLMLGRGVMLSRRGAWLARIGFVRLALHLATGGRRALPKLMARLSSSRSGSNLMERLAGEVRKLPETVWPAVRAHWCRPESFLAMADHLQSLPAVAAAVHAASGLGDLPLVVISGSHLTPQQLQEHRELAALSSQGRHVTAEGSGHWVHLDRPELVAAAIRSVCACHHR